MTKRDSSLSLREGRNCQNNTGFPEKKRGNEGRWETRGRKRKEVERGECAIGAIATSRLACRARTRLAWFCGPFFVACMQKRASKYQQGHGDVFSAMHRGP